MKFNSLSVFLSLLIITVLPFSAYAELTSDESGSPAVSDNYPPYALATPTQADQGHIATTAYVKGAYNDAITAVNTLYEDVNSSISDLSDAVDGKQDKLTAIDGNNTTDISTDVLTNLYDAEDDSQLATAFAVKGAVDGKQNRLVITSQSQNGLPTRTYMDNEIVTDLSNVDNNNQLVNGMAVRDAINSRRVTIYTTWGSNATTDTNAITQIGGRVVQGI